VTSYNSNEDVLFKDYFDKFIPTLEKGKTSYVYAHNLSSFDGVLLLKTIHPTEGRTIISYYTLLIFS
jgi:hypothetical protein